MRSRSPSGGIVWTRSGRCASPMLPTLGERLIPNAANLRTPAARTRRHEPQPPQNVAALHSVTLATTYRPDGDAVLLSRILRPTENLLRRGDVHHWRRCAVCDAFHALPITDQRSL